MITIHTSPSPANVTPAAARTSQQATLPSDLAGLSDDRFADSFRGVLLQHYVNQVIVKNERNHVVTDVSILDMHTGTALVGHNLDTEQFAASVNKLPVTALVLRDLRAGTITLGTQLTWQPSDVRAGEGFYDQPGAPTTATVQQLLFDMLNRSGNTPVRALVNYALSGAAQVNTRIVNELGLHHTYLQPLDANRFYLGNTTARDAAAGIRLVLGTQDLPGSIVKDALVTNIYTNYGVKSQLAGNDYIVLANKIGILDDVDGNNRHDVGIIYNTKTYRSYAYAFINTAPGLNYEQPTAQAGASLADMGAALLRYAGDKPVRDGGIRPLDAQSQPKPETKIKY